MKSGGNEMLDFTDRESVKKFVRENGIKDMLQLNGVVKQMMGALIEEMLEVEREAYLGYPILVTQGISAGQMSLRKMVTPGMVILPRRFALLTVICGLIYPGIGMVTSSQNSSRSMEMTYLR